MIGNKSMIQCVYEQVKKANCVNEIVVATDDDRILKVVESFKGNALMTSALHSSGTERCAEVLNYYSNNNQHFDLVINIQGDEPFIQPTQLEGISKCFDNKGVQIATLAKKITKTDELFNPNVVKVVVANNSHAIYFSRSPIPFLRGKTEKDWVRLHNFYKHIGMYAYRSEVLKKIVTLKPSVLEQKESLEQLRWIENNFTIFVAETEKDSISVDSPEDLAEICKNLNL